MKLINRDKFISDMFDFYIENRWSPRDIHFSLLDVRSNIDSPEFEVKAIPIEWIENYVRKHFTLGDWFGDVLSFLVNMLEDWEKENGQK